MCGGAHRLTDRLDEAAGLSPRVRGSRSRSQRTCPRCGSIPACAGEPSARPSAPAPERVYPRVCGGAFPATVRSADESGLSPRVRGEPRPRCPSRPRSRVYPRVCGGAVQFPFVGIGDRVYPRVCGGAVSSPVTSLWKPGLSPRVRGSHVVVGVFDLRQRSIPACAGEPSPRSGLRRCPRVYPRVCGGAVSTPPLQTADWGLSPRVRGSRGGQPRDGQRCGSIPACAGEPWRATSGWSAMRVYPRVCGGAFQGR